MDDDDEDREFSKSIVCGFIEQANDTFKQMDESMYVLLGLFIKV
jgi:osomolarity two-component system phosphorelay intermediate protein YPD1